MTVPRRAFAATSVVMARLDRAIQEKAIYFNNNLDSRVIVTLLHPRRPGELPVRMIQLIHEHSGYTSQPPRKRVVPHAPGRFACFLHSGPGRYQEPLDAYEILFIHRNGKYRMGHD